MSIIIYFTQGLLDITDVLDNILKITSLDCEVLLHFVATFGPNCERKI